MASATQNATWIVNIFMIVAVAFLMILCMETFRYRGYLSTDSRPSTNLPRSTSSTSGHYFSGHPKGTGSGTIETDEFCKALISNPKPCVRDSKVVPCVEGASTSNPVMFSWNQQDYYLYSRHFQYLPRTKPAVYLDIATNHPTLSSNTFFFDRCLKWRGFCIEANDQYYEPIFRERTCELIPTCMGAKYGEEVSFHPHGFRGGIVGDNYKFKDKLDGKVWNNRQVKTLKCTTVEDTLTRQFKVKRVDYMSLDIEGHELQVLKGINWDELIINVMTVEIGPKLPEIKQFLAERGYYQHHVNITKEEREKYGKIVNTDAIFLHNSAVFGSPV